MATRRNTVTGLEGTYDTNPLTADQPEQPKPVVPEQTGPIAFVKKNWIPFLLAAIVLIIVIMIVLGVSLSSEGVTVSPQPWLSNRWIKGGRPIY